jgi:hypothetical protein
VSIPVGGVETAFSETRLGDRWGAYGRVGRTMVSIVARGYDPKDIQLEPIDDLGPHAEHARAKLRAEIERDMTAEMRRQRTRRTSSPDERAARLAVHTLLHDLDQALHQIAGAPKLRTFFTEVVTDRWGGSERYEQLLWLHTMLRPMSGYGTVTDTPALEPDGSAVMQISAVHATPSDGGGLLFETSILRSSDDLEDEPPVERAAIRRGEEHFIRLRFVPDADGWKIDTDLLAILIDRVGSIDQIVKPLSQQSG